MFYTLKHKTFKLNALIHNLKRGTTIQILNYYTTKLYLALYDHQKNISLTKKLSSTNEISASFGFNGKSLQKKSYFELN